MTLKFKIRVSKKTKEGDYSPIYVRLYDGAICDQTVKTRCMVQPHFWALLASHVMSQKYF